MAWFTSRPDKRRKRFWKWFVRNEARILRIAGPDDPFIVTVGRQVQRVCRGLMQELSCADDHGVRDFVISADGRRELVDEVESLADSAPPLERFRIIRFRPPHLDIDDLTLGMGDVELRANDLQVAWGRAADGLIDILLLVPPMPGLDAQRISHAALLMLDAIVGEYNVMCRIGAVEIAEAGDPQVNQFDFHPIAELREVLAEQQGGIVGIALWLVLAARE